MSEDEGSWNWANVQSAGGGCLIVGDQLHFYVSGRQGRPGTDAPGVCSTGLATLRRDGFARWTGCRTRRRVTRVGARRRRGDADDAAGQFSGAHLFVNADLSAAASCASKCSIAQGTVLAPFTRDACVPVTGDGTRLPVALGQGDRSPRWPDSRCDSDSR